MKTIKQIADELGVSKQAVYKRYKGKLYTVVAPYAHTDEGILCIEEQGENLIKQDFLKDDVSIGAHTERIHDTHTDALFDMLKNELEIKNEQIKELNARLAETTAALVSAQQAVQAAQALHAGTIRQQIESSVADPEEPETTPPKKQGIFIRLFGKNGTRK
jgi:AcrR family transcriptional regulator